MTNDKKELSTTICHTCPNQQDLCLVWILGGGSKQLDGHKIQTKNKYVFIYIYLSSESESCGDRGHPQCNV